MLIFSRIMPRPFVRFLGKERVTDLSRKTALFLAILTAMTLAACGKDSDEAVSGTEQTTVISESAEVETTAAVTSETEAETTAAKPEIFSAEEKYKSYPMEIVYPEAQETDITAEYTEIAEKFANPDGYCVVDFSVKYPVFRSESVDSAALEKINGEIKTYIDARYDGWKKLAENTTDEKDTYFFDTELYELREFVYQVDISVDNEFCDCNGYDVCGNLLSVNFVDYYYGAGAAHGIEVPMVMMYDLTTGEQLNILQLLGDREGFEAMVRDKSAEYGNPAPLTNDDEVIAEYERVVDAASEDKEMMDTFAVVAEENNYRYSAKNGCICFYLAPYEYGTYVDGIRRVEMPISEVLPFLNDDGKALFEGVASATAEPAMVMVENGDEKIISREQAEVILSEGEE